jgi:cytochrome b subunit of formate dehydrogenase
MQTIHSLTWRHMSRSTALLVVGAAWFAPGVLALDNSDCYSCHDDPKLATTNATGKSVSLCVTEAAFAASVHASNKCTTCHVDIADLPHAKKLKPAVCAQCHKAQTEVFLKSDHGHAMSQGVTEAPGCASCHGEAHKMLSARNPDSPAHHINVPATCSGCHGKDKETEMEKFHLRQHSPGVSYEKSAHGIALLKKNLSVSAVCTDCHGAHDIVKSSAPGSRLHWQNIATTCGKCHDGIQRAYLRSVHGKALLAGDRHAPVCTDCHGEHNLAAVSNKLSRASSARISETCGQCHAAERIVTKYRLPDNSVNSYMQSFHGLSMQLGTAKAANCASCHSAHDILPSSDPRSSVHRDRLQETCDRCHPGIGSQISSAKIHTGTDGTSEHVSVTYVRWFYYILIAGVLGGMFIHNLLDFAQKFLEHAKKQRARGGAVRMSVGDRIQHAVLVITFVVLVYTGFALKFPNAWWARPCAGLVDWRGVIHRAAALAFVLLCVWHSCYVLFTDRGRRHLRALLPAWSDFDEAWSMFLFYLRIRPERPKLGYYSYVEKAEYWALVWGSVIMVLTGALMTWEVWTLRTFPKWVYDLVTAIHYYEAILATAAIVIWHFYFSIFDPEEYPMKMTMLTGLESEADKHNRQKI